MHVFQELFSQKGNDIMACLDQTLGLMIKEAHLFLLGVSLSITPRVDYFD